ncbi:hypothetical protein A2U01_0049846, partial [Trifolium medium]|nr:hypothetical protein [Trifolium medium]
PLFFRVFKLQRQPVKNRQPPPKRQREEVPVIDLDLERPFLLPRCFSAQGYLEKHPLVVAEVERSFILGLEPAARQEQLVQDTAAMMRLMEMVMVLNDERGSSFKDLEKLKARNEKLEAKVLKLELEVTDHKEKSKVFAEQTAELRETKAELERVKKEFEDLKTNAAEE